MLKLIYYLKDKDGIRAVAFTLFLMKKRKKVNENRYFIYLIKISYFKNIFVQKNDTASKII